MKFLQTPGFQRATQEAGYAAIRAGLVAAMVLAKAGAGNEPSWVIGDPAVETVAKEDEGRTLKMNAPFRFYAIRDDHPKGCDCGCGGGSVVTMLLPEEY